MAEGPDLLLKLLQQGHVGLLLQDRLLLGPDAVLSGGVHGRELKQEHACHNQRKEEGGVAGVRRQIREQKLLQGHNKRKGQADHQGQKPSGPAAEHGRKIAVEPGPFQNGSHQQSHPDSQHIGHVQPHEGQEVLPVKQRRILLHHIQHGVVGRIDHKSTQNGRRKGVQQREAMDF